MAIAIIPARAGSKRIPHKNIKNFCGKPMISYAINMAISSNAFDSVIVSTDSEIIADIAINLGASVPFLRKKELSDDYTGTVSVISDAIIELEKINIIAKHYCCIYATTPLLLSSDISSSFKEMNEKNADYCFVATTYNHPIQRALKIKDDGRITPFYPNEMSKRTQDLEIAYHDAGQFYWGKHDTWLTQQNIFSNNCIPYIIPHYRAIDIDTEEDWKHAELIYSALVNNCSKHTET
nr:pseudaminic acid cytidylyltransferase [uncultured Tolumonas sp.]